RVGFQHCVGVLIDLNRERHGFRFLGHGGILARLAGILNPISLQKRSFSQRFLWVSEINHLAVAKPCRKISA
ncbi:MAG: hypothetical protein KDE20_21635, partial [Caldilineaceae bacterium]|nr:hypothetical protein [Caldilineaceae bacterium]